jgi:hypothetical protein
MLIRPVCPIGDDRGVVAALHGAAIGAIGDQQASECYLVARSGDRLGVERFPLPKEPLLSSSLCASVAAVWR